MNHPNFFEKRPDLVSLLPVTYLLKSIRNLPPDSVITKIDQAMKKGGIAEVKKDIKKYRQISIKKDYFRNQRWMIIEYSKHIKRMITSFERLPGRIEALRESTYNDYEIYDFLEKINEEKFIQDIDKAIEILHEIKKSFLSISKHYKKAIVVKKSKPVSDLKVSNL